MRIRYIGLDNRTRITEALRVKFFSDGFQPTDKRDEVEDNVFGPVIVVHLTRNRGGKRLTMQVPDDFDIETAKQNLLEKGWADLSNCTLKTEHLY